MKNEQNRPDSYWDIDEKVILRVNAATMEKWEFLKMAARHILWHTMPSNFMQNIRKIQWMDLEK